MKKCLLPLLVMFLCLPYLPAAERSKAEADQIAFGKLKSLAGSWQGQADMEGDAVPAGSRIKVIADGKIISLSFGETTREEAVLMIHPDGEEIMATLYGFSDEQSRLIFAPGSNLNQIIFKFRDATNLLPGHGHVQQITFTVDGPDHHALELELTAGGALRAGTIRFDFRRKP